MFRSTMRLVGGMAASLVCLGGPLAAQETGGGLSTTIPTLRGAVEDPNDVPPATLGQPAAAPFSQAPAVPDGDGKIPQPKPPRFVYPKGTAKTQERAAQRLPRKGPPPLPPLQPYPTAARLRGSGAAIDTTGTQVNAAPLVPGPTVAALPVPPPSAAGLQLRTRLIDDTGYDPIGYQVGSLRLTPFVAQSLGYDSNPDQTQTGVRPSAFSRTEGGFGLLSQWTAHELRADIRGGYNEYFSDHDADRPDATGTVDLRIDADRNLALDAEGRFALDTQRPGSPEVSVNAVDRPLITTVGGTVGATQTLGRVSLGLHGSLDRVDYENATLSSGAIEDLSDENYNDFGLRVRAAYELTPVLKPYVDLLADDRLHDHTIDLSGYRRDSVGLTAQLGSTFEITRLLSGDISGGYGRRSYDDPRLRDLDGPVVNGVLSYAITPLTTINLRAATSFDETTLAGSSGSQSRSVTLDVTHALFRNLTLTGAVSYLNTDYQGVAITENTLSETLKAEYHLSRSLVATAAYNHERLDSTAAGSSFDENVILFGLRAQR